MSAERLRLDSGDLHKGDFSDCLSLKDLVGRIEDQAKSRGRVVCSVSVNGMDLSEADENRLGSTLKKDIDFIEVETELPLELMRSTVESQLCLMDEIDRVAQAAASAFREMDLSRGHELLISLLDGCRWFTDALLALRQVSYALPEHDHKTLVQTPPWREAEIRLQGVLQEVLKSVEAQDKILLADLLEYELANSLEPWRDLLKAIAR